MVQPTDYILTRAVDPMQAFTQGQTQGQNLMQGAQTMQMNDQAMQENQYKLAALQQAQQVAMQRKQAYDARRSELMEGVTDEKYLQNALRLQSEFPEMTKGENEALSQMSAAKKKQSFQTAMQVRGLALAGQHQKAHDLLMEQAAGLRNSGDEQNAKATESLAQTMLDSPQYAAGIASHAAAALMDPKDASEYLKNEATATNQAANAAKLAAETAEIAANAQAERQAKIDKAKVDVENAKTARMQAGNSAQANQLRAQELAATREVNRLQREKWDYSRTLLPAALQPKMTEAVEAASSKMAAADSADSLALDLSTDLGGGGRAYRSVAEWMKGNTGAQDQYSALRGRYLTLKNKMVGEMGKDFKPMSNSDLTMLQASFPSENDSPEYLAQFVSAMGRAFRIESKLEESKAEWMQANQGMGKTVAAKNIMGVEVPAGTTYMEYRRKYLPQVIKGVLGNDAKPSAPPADVAGASYMQLVGGGK